MRKMPHLAKIQPLNIMLIYRYLVGWTSKQYWVTQDAGVHYAKIDLFHAGILKTK